MWWEIRVDGHRLSTTTGVVGDAGSTVSRDFPSAADASLAAESLVSERLGRGYVEVSPPDVHGSPAIVSEVGAAATCAACGRPFGSADERFCAGCGTPRASQVETAASQQVIGTVEAHRVADPSVVHCAAVMETAGRFVPDRRDGVWYVERLRVNHVSHPYQPWHGSAMRSWCDSSDTYSIYDVDRRPAARVTMLSWTSRGKSELRIRADFGSNVPVRAERSFGYWVTFTTAVAFKDGAAASAALERLQVNPEAVVQLLRQSNPPGKVLEALDGPVLPAFRSLRPVLSLDARPSGPDGASSASDLGLLQIVVADQLGLGRPAKPKSGSARVDLLRRLPMRPGYAAGIKALVKTADDPRVFGTAAGRIASGAPGFAQYDGATAPPVPAWVLQMIPEWVQRRRMTEWGLTQDSIDYLNRLVRRRLKGLARSKESGYVDAALALLTQLDAEGGAPEGRRRAFAANYVIYGDLTRDVGHGRYEELPSPDVRQSQRFDPHPEMWDGAKGKVERAWKRLRHDVDTFTWMTLVLGREGAAELDWTIHHVDLGFRSRNGLCQSLAKEQLESRGIDALRPEEGDREGWKVFLRVALEVHSFSLQRDAIDSAVSALRPSAGASWPDWLQYFSLAAPYLHGVALERCVDEVLARMPAKSPTARRALVVRLIRSGDPIRAALGWLALSQPKVVRTSPEHFVAGMPYQGGSYTWNAFTPLTQDIIETGTCALRSGLAPPLLWSTISLACTPESAGIILAELVPSHPELARLVWRQLDDEVMAGVWANVEAGRLTGPLREAVSLLGPRAVGKPGPRQREFLEQWMRAEPQEWLGMPPHLEAIFRGGDVALIDQARDLVQRQGAMEDFWLTLAESQSPLAARAVIDFLQGVSVDRQRECVLALLDSSAASARQLGWDHYSALSQAEQMSVADALLEHRDPDVMNRVAKMLDGSERPSYEALRSFDRSVLLSRRSLRTAKAAVQSRWDATDASQIDRGVLVELALSTSKIDADWAWRLLAKLEAVPEAAGSPS